MCGVVCVWCGVCVCVRERVCVGVQTVRGSNKLCCSLHNTHTDERFSFHLLAAATCAQRDWWQVQCLVIVFTEAWHATILLFDGSKKHLTSLIYQPKVTNTAQPKTMGNKTRCRTRQE